jgi:4-hydroxy-3-polyprenylbenzoate decarboxylase
MAFSGLSEFISLLEKNGELQRIKAFVDPVLEIAEITDRVTKSGGKALLFENTGTIFPVLINGFGSDRRIAMALGIHDLSEYGSELGDLFGSITNPPASFRDRMKALPGLLKIAGCIPVKKKRRGKCQKVIINEPDLNILPVLKCWPYDGGRFVTLPMVHTIHPETGSPNIGMYRMQVLDRNTTGMHWQRHKTGANHYEAWKRLGKKMPVSVALGGDPVYTYCATAPLPENISEYLLAGFLRKKKVKLVKCITNDLYVPDDADIVIEGYVDPSEELVAEGPFGDHTGFYSLADYYPGFHVTAITHSKNAVYPATIVGIPPQEDAWLTKATERIFLSPVKLAVQPEIVDLHMPDAGVAHNLVIVKIKKTYPGQGMKVINSLFGAGQMMFSKYIVVVDGEINIRNYQELIGHILANTGNTSDILFMPGPMDVLDHSSDSFSFGGKAGIDATVKFPEEKPASRLMQEDTREVSYILPVTWLEVPFIKSFKIRQFYDGNRILILAIDHSSDNESLQKVINLLRSASIEGAFRLILAVDHTVDPEDSFDVAWQVLANSDPVRDHYELSPGNILIDGTIKFYRKEGFLRKWPNVVCSDEATIEIVDRKWDSLGFNSFIPSPSKKYRKLLRRGTDEIIA